MSTENDSTNRSQIVAYALIGFGSLTLLSGMPFDMITMALGGAVTFWGLRMNNQVRKQKRLMSYNEGSVPSRRFEMDDKMMIRLAERLGGKLSAEDVAKHTSLSYDDAKKRLEALHVKGVLELDLEDIDENGRIFYKVN